MVVHALGDEPLQFYVLDDTVDVVSEGLLVSEHGWAYNNGPGSGSILTKPGRRRIKCHREANVPLICTNTPDTSSDSTYIPSGAMAEDHDHADFQEQVFDVHSSLDPDREQIFDEVFEEPNPAARIILEVNNSSSEEPSPAPDSAVPPPPEIPPEHFRTHTPKHPKCPICNGVKMQF